MADLLVFVQDLTYNGEDDVIAFYATYCLNVDGTKYIGDKVGTMSLPGANDGATALNVGIFNIVETYAEAQHTQTVGPSDRRFIAGRVFIPPVLSQSSASRSLNSAFQISAVRNALVNYSIDIESALTLTGGEAGTVYLEIADDSGFTTNVQEICRFANSNTGTLTVGLSNTQVNTGQLTGVIPAAKYVRLRTSDDTGSPTFTYRSGQEALN